MTRMGRLVAIGAVAVMGLVGGMAPPSEAVTVTFNCEINDHSPGTACVPGGPFGDLTLQASAIDPQRVDVSWALTPSTGDAIERVLLNFGPDLPDHSQLRLLAAGSGPGAQGPTLGAALICDDCQTLGQFGFDIRLSPQGLPTIFAGSLALFDVGGVVDQQLPLGVDDLFPVLTVPSVVNPGQPPLLAGYRTTVAGASIGEFWAGATPTVTPVNPVPEPTTLLLLGTGILGVGLVRRIGRLESKRTRRA